MSLPGAIALNWCCVIVCIRDYMKKVDKFSQKKEALFYRIPVQGINVLCIEYSKLVHENEKSWKDISEFCGIKSEEKMTKVLNR